MGKRLADRALAFVALVLLAPIILVAALAVVVTSGKPILFRARRTGLNSEEFWLLKFRTMENGSAQAGDITVARDTRVTPAGRILRRLKIDELPQLWNVVRGEMALVGPRPESPRIVLEHYTPEHLETLKVLPGLTSPGSLFNYSHGERMLDGPEPEERYIRDLLPTKLALELNYVQNQSAWRDIRISVRTLSMLFQAALGRKRFPYPPEYEAALREHYYTTTTDRNQFGSDTRTSTPENAANRGDNAIDL